MNIQIKNSDKHQRLSFCLSRLLDGVCRYVIMLFNRYYHTVEQSLSQLLHACLEPDGRNQVRTALSASLNGLCNFHKSTDFISLDQDTFPWPQSMHLLALVI